jgi:hypothetical protein
MESPPAEPVSQANQERFNALRDALIIELKPSDKTLKPKSDTLKVSGVR